MSSLRYPVLMSGDSGFINRLLCIRSRKGLCMKIVFKFLALFKRKIYRKFVFASWKTLTNLKKIVPEAAS
jgi:hypothetical protein